MNFGAAVNLPTIIEGDRTLSAAEGPYIVQRYLIIPEGVTLTMEAGTSVWTESGGLVVKGVLDVKGTSAAPVRLYGNSIERWKGILIDNASTASQIRHARIVGADQGLKTRDSDIELENVDFISNRWGMVVEGGSVTMRGGSIRLSEKVGLSVQKAQVSISNSRFFENTVGGVQFKQSDLNFRNNEIHGNGEWEARNLDPENTLSLIENWWGGTRMASVRLEGDIVIEPALESSASKLRK